VIVIAIALALTAAGGPVADPTDRVGPAMCASAETFKRAMCRAYGLGLVHGASLQEAPQNGSLYCLPADLKGDDLIAVLSKMPAQLW
jgi:hypothetical protein